jgi:CARDB
MAIQQFNALLLSGAALRAGETVTTATAIPLSQSVIPGAYTIDIVPDPGNEVAESNESNNTRSVNFYVAVNVPRVGPPVSIGQCKNGGWHGFNIPRTFKSEGDCILFVIRAEIHSRLAQRRN